MPQEVSETVWSIILGYSLRVLGVLVVLSVGWMLAGWARRLALRALERAELDATLSKFFSKMARWAVIVLTGLTCLGIFGIQTTSFAAVIAAAGLAIGLAFQGTLSNFAAGVMLLIFRPFKVGDMVQVAGKIGRVDELDLFTIVLDTPDHRRIILPNSAVFGQTIENITYHQQRRVEISFTVPRAADIDQTRQILSRAVEAVPNRVKEQPAEVLIIDLDATTVKWQARVWGATEEVPAVNEALIRAVKNALDEEAAGRAAAASAASAVAKVA
jgi:small conductance mechanosensitive channel